MLIPMEVIGVRVEMPSNQPIVLLKEIASLSIRLHAALVRGGLNRLRS